MAKKKTAKKKEEILGATYEEGLPKNTLNWRSNLGDRKQMLAYLETGERYFYSKEGFGSEKRKKPA